MKEVLTFTNQYPIYVEAHIADIHFGAIDPQIQYQILYEQFLVPLSTLQVLDIVSINGDLYDHKFMANSNAVMYASYFINQLVQICKSKNATLIMINGTGSHDADQLKLFSPYLQDPYLDFRLVLYDAQFHFIKGKKILLIPELYNKGKEYYENFLFNQGVYDSCYLHGTFAGAIAGKNEPNLDSDREPVFKIEDFSACRGPIIAGHNHVFSRYKGDFYYSGSPIRWKFGEEEEKGFIILLHKPQSRQYLVHFEPIKSFRYDTVILDQMLEDDPKHIIDYIDSLKRQGIDYIRIKFTKNNVEKILLLKNYYRTRSDIKIETNFEQEKLRKEIEQIDERYQSYDYLFDKNLSPNEILVRYINQEYQDSYWTVDTLKEFLHEIEKL